MAFFTVLRVLNRMTRHEKVLVWLVGRKVISVTLCIILQLCSRRLLIIWMLFRNSLTPSVDRHPQHLYRTLRVTENFPLLSSIFMNGRTGMSKIVDRQQQAALGISALYIARVW